MRTPLVLFAIAALAAAWCVPAASEDATQVPVRVLCSPDGKPVEIRMLVPEPGLFTLKLPPDICSPAVDAPAQQPRPPVSAPPSLQI